MINAAARRTCLTAQSLKLLSFFKPSKLSCYSRAFFELTWSNKGFAVDTSILNELPPVAAQTNSLVLKYFAFLKEEGLT